VWLLAGSAILSFDALRQFALRSSVIHSGLGPLGESDLAGVFALIIDALVWVGILGVKLYGTGDVKAWAALGIGLGFTLGFQVFLPGEPITLPGVTGRAVPPLALAVGIVVLEVRATAGERKAPRRPDAPPAAPEPPSPSELARAEPARRPSRRTPHREPTAEQRRRAVELFESGRSKQAVMRETGLSYTVVKGLAPSTNGDSS
jgi:hypothetical protein